MEILYRAIQIELYRGNSEHQQIVQSVATGKHSFTVLDSCLWHMTPFWNYVTFFRLMKGMYDKNKKNLGWLATIIWGSLGIGFAAHKLMFETPS